MSNQRKQQRRIRALARFPKTAKAEEGKRTEPQRQAEHAALVALIGNDRL